MELLQIVTAFLYYKVRHGLLQIATGITKCNGFVTNCDSTLVALIIYLQKMNPSRRQLGNECFFQTRRISLNYSLGENNNVSEDYRVLVSMSTNNSESNAIKSNKFGKISLGNWKDCRAWFDVRLKK